MEPIRSFKGDYRFLSNFWKLDQPVLFDGLEFYTVEAAYVAAKTSKKAFRENISYLSPFEAKDFGKEIEEHAMDMDPLWKNEEYRLSHMRNLVTQKFSNNPDLKAKLLETGTTELIEGNTWHDNFWGDCSCERCEKTLGGNRLGLILMHVRGQLASQAAGS